MADVTERSHAYHAEATVLQGELTLPLTQNIYPQAQATLPESGGYLSQHAQDFKLEGVVSFHTAYTQVGGNPDEKPGHGWTTLATSVIEGLNILDIVTADRVVAQISTEHPLIGHVPTISFLGTRFENLRIAGHLVKLHLDPDILGKKPEGDAPYTRDPGFRSRVASQYKLLRKHPDTLSEAFERYNQVPADTEDAETVECSLVNQAEGSYPGNSYGHVIHVPNFGTIYLATLRLEHEQIQQGTPHRTTVHLKMVEAKMGCLAAGSVSAASTKTNGHSYP